MYLSSPHIVRKTQHFDNVWNMCVRVQVLHIRDSAQDSLEVICIIIVSVCLASLWYLAEFLVIIPLVRVISRVQVWHSTCHASLLPVLKAQNYY